MKVQVSMPIYSSAKPQTLLSLLKMFLFCARKPLDSESAVTYRFWSDSILLRGRHALVELALQAGASHILWIDSDMVFPEDTLHRLAVMRKPVAAANCLRRMDPYTWTAVDENGKEIISSGRSGVQKVCKVGFGVTLMDLEIFRRSDPPFFQFEWITDDPVTKRGHYRGEDFYLFEKLRKEQDIYPFIDHDLSQEVGHIGEIEVTQTFSDAWRGGAS